MAFRTAFAYDKAVFWYPQHQSRALRQLENGIHHIDLVVEVRDARMPLTSISSQFDQALGRRDRLVVYNKSDLANRNLQKPLSAALKEFRNEHCIFTTADRGVNVKAILEKAIEKCSNDPVRYPYLSLVVVGMPNVGKSTIINSLRNLGVRKGRVTAVGKTAGVTTAIQTRVKIFEDPPIYLVDTPGIFDPRVSSPLEGLKISLTGCTKDKFTEVVCVADYLLFRLNNSKNRKSYCEYFNIEPTDEIYQLLGHICESRDFRILFRSRLNKVLNSSTEIVKGNGLSKENRPYDLDRAARYLLDEYREGRFGGMTLDDCSPLGLKEWFDKHPSTHNYKLA